MYRYKHIFVRKMHPSQGLQETLRRGKCGVVDLVAVEVERMIYRRLFCLFAAGDQGENEKKQNRAHIPKVGFLMFLSAVRVAGRIHHLQVYDAPSSWVTVRNPGPGSGKASPVKHIRQQPAGTHLNKKESRMLVVMPERPGLRHYAALKKQLLPAG